MADQILKDPVVVQVANTAPAETISHCVYPVPGGRKADLLEALLTKTPHDCVLVFTRTKHRAKSLARRLEGRGWLATSLQGNLSQNRRQGGPGRLQDRQIPDHGGHGYRGPGH